MFCRRSFSLARLPSPSVKRQHRHQHFASSRATTTLPLPRISYKDIAERVAYKCANSALRKSPATSQNVEEIAHSYNRRKQIEAELNYKRNARSAVGEVIRESAQKRDEEVRKGALAEATRLKAAIGDLEAELVQLEDRLLTLALALPNDTHPSTPPGPESAAVTLSTHGQEPAPADAARDHVSICKKFDLLDLESASAVTGSSWYYLKNEAALLELALTNYAMSVAMQRGFAPVLTPDVVRADIASRCGFQPRDNSDPPMSQMYHIDTNPGSPELVLSGTAEIPLAGMFANKIFPETALPKKVVGLGHSFRHEAGARGTDTRGLYRVHQFTKVELFAVTKADSSEAMMEEMLDVQKAILEGLNIPLRVLLMPTEELGASAYQKYDIEAWMLGRGGWGEVTSLSNCTDYQARRLHIRYRSDTSKAESASAAQISCPTAQTTVPFAHTLNGTAAAIPRLIVALLENGAVMDDDSQLVGLRLPGVLKPFWMGGRQFIEWA